MNRMSRHLALAVVAIASQCVPAAAANESPQTQPAGAGSNWPNWLGPDCDSTSPEKGLLRQWPKGGPQVLWRVPIDMGYSCPSVRDGRVFITGQFSNQPDARGQSVICLDLASGKQLWRFTYTDTTAERKYRTQYGPYSTPTVLKDRLLTFDSGGNLYCLDPQTGKEIWHRDIYGDYGFLGEARRDKGWICSPIVIDKIGVLNIGPGKDSKKTRLIGFDVRTGKEAWVYRMPVRKDIWGPDTSGWQTPQVTTFAGEACVMIYACGWLKAVRASDGEEVFSLDLMSAPDKDPMLPGMIPTLTIADRFILIAPANDRLRGQSCLVEIDRFKPPFDSKVIWKKDLDIYYAQWVHRDGYLYGFRMPAGDKKDYLADQDLVCVELKTGEVKWAQKGFPQCVSLIEADGLLIARSKNALILAEASPEGYVERGRLAVEAWYEPKKENFMKGATMPVLSDGKLLVRTWYEMICLKVK